jgi:glycosyltransferase involved in cell wall biosynthesis
MSHKYKLAFCIPVYHAEKYIQRMITSIAAQKVDFPMEVVLAVDPRDGTDYSALILPILDGMGIHLTEKHCDPRTGETAGSARNVAFSLCDSDYVWFVDADDWLCDQNAASWMVSIANANHCDVCECQFDGPFPCKQSRMMAWLRILSYDLAKDHPFPNQKTQEDRDMYIQLTRDPRYVSAKIIDAPFYHYDWGRKDSVTGGEVLV